MNTTIRHTRFRSQSRHTALAAGLLALFLFYFVGGSLFTHAHRFGNNIVVHSHYYAHPWRTSTDATTTHSHSPEQFKTIQHLDYLIFIVTAIGLTCLAFRRVTAISAPYHCIRLTATRPHFTTRGPPATI